MRAVVLIPKAYAHAVATDEARFSYGFWGQLRSFGEIHDTLGKGIGSAIIG